MIDAFAIPIYKENILNKKLNNSLYDDIVTEYKKDKAQEDKGRQSATIKFENDLMVISRYSELEDLMQFHVREYVNKLVGQEVCKTYWKPNHSFAYINRSNMEELNWHSHSSYNITAVYYVSIFEGNNSLYLKSPLQPLIDNWWIHHHFGEDQRWRQTINVKPAVGDIVIFPSWLEHSNLRIDGFYKTEVPVSSPSTHVAEYRVSISSHYNFPVDF